MNENPQIAAAAREINRLHEEVVHRSAQSQAELNAALVAAWRCGKLLTEQKARVRRCMGGGAWCLWLEKRFKASRRTAAKYMALAATVTEEASLKGMSLRQAYFRLGISTEPKCRQNAVAVAPLPEHIRLTTRLLVALRTETGGFEKLAPDRAATFRDDLRKLYDELRRLFEPEGAKPGLFGSKQA